MIAPKEKPTVNLLGTDGNAFFILGRVERKLRAAGADQEYIGKYLDEATLGDYDHLLQTTMKYVDVA